MDAFKTFPVAVGLCVPLFVSVAGLGAPEGAQANAAAEWPGPLLSLSLPPSPPPLPVVLPVGLHVLPTVRPPPAPRALEAPAPVVTLHMDLQKVFGGEGGRAQNARQRPSKRRNQHPSETIPISESLSFANGAAPSYSTS